MKYRITLVVALAAFPSFATAQSATVAAWEKIYASLQPEFKQAIEVTVEEVSQAPVEGTWQFVDVRTSDEQSVSMIPGAITLKQFESAPQHYRQTHLVVYCTVGYRSGMIAMKWRDKGYDIRNLKGGVLAWANAGKVFQSPTGGETKRVHIYGKEWNRLPAGYQPVW